MAADRDDSGMSGDLVDLAGSELELPGGRFSVEERGTNMLNWIKQFWPEILAVVALIVDQAVKQMDQLASSHEHASVIIVVALVLLRRLQTWLSGKGTDPALPSPPSTYNRQGRAS